MPVAAPAPPPPAETYSAVAAATGGAADEVPSGPLSAADLDGLSSVAFGGGLSGTDRERLSTLGADDPLYTRGYTLLYLDAKARGDRGGQAGYLATMMALPENQYNPALLVEEAHAAMVANDWSRALDRAQLAERHWARLPSDLIFTRKALIYEIVAKAHLGRFYASEGEDAMELYKAISGWEKYRRHAEAGSRSDLVANANQQLDELYDIKRRLE